MSPPLECSIKAARSVARPPGVRKPIATTGPDGLQITSRRLSACIPAWWPAPQGHALLVSFMALAQRPLVGGYSILLRCICNLQP